ncbi:MAG: hypothetical protein KGH66_02900, partial [Candidatus Micrarchaeota archaeon]|nr:hypothetical protein [Candidatus Micrarchaeota archaeon]
GSGAAINSNLGSGQATGLYAVALYDYINPELQAAYNSVSGILGLQSGVNAIKDTRVTTWLPVPIPIPAPGFIYLPAFQFGVSVPLFTSTYISGTNSVGSIDLGSTNSFIINIEDFVMVPVLLALLIQSNIFYFLTYMGLGFFLPAGIVLRSIPFLRGIGGTLIAIGITLAIIYPAMVIAVNMPITNFVNSIFVNSAPPAPSTSCDLSYSGDVTGGIVPAVQCAFLDTAATLITGAYSITPNGSPAPVALLLGLDQAAVPATKSHFYEGFDIGYYSSFNSIIPALDFVTYNTFDMVLQMMLLIFDLVIGIVVAGAIATALGGKLRLGIGKVKLT